jgi:tetratricopeptide (TPR) repeat protein
MAPVSYADKEFVQQRLKEYQNKLNLWLELSETDEESKLAEELSARGIECVQLLERLLTGYSLLLERMQQSETVHIDRTATVDPKRMQQLDIAFLESRCVDILTTDKPSQPELTAEEAQSPFEETQKVIASLLNNEKYQDAILWYSSLEQDYPNQKPSIQTELNYGLALQYTGQVEAAAKQFSKMLASGDLATEPLSLQLEIAELLLASGNIAAAETYYESTIKAHKSKEAEKNWALAQLDFLRSVDPQTEGFLSYIKLVHDFQVYDYRVHSVALNRLVDAFEIEHSDSPLAEGALRLKEFTIQQMHSWFDRQLVTVDALVENKRFAEAAEILKNMTHYYLPADMQAIVQKTYYEVGQAEIQETEYQRLLKEQELTEKWETAIHLMDSQRFEDAIAAFETLQETELAEKASFKIVEAANLAAVQMRKDAASLFMQASKTPDVEKKKELLLDSHRMLNEVLVKFPQTDLLEKVQQNLTILEEQIRKIDPALLDLLQEEYSADASEEPLSPFSSESQ